MINPEDIIKIQNATSYASYDKYLQTIVNTTTNTWQKTRDMFSKTTDTEQGKLAENIVEIYIKSNFNNITYLSYDDFRTDNFQKHAPFDGLLFKKSINQKTLESLIADINTEIKNNTYGQMSDPLKQKLLIANIYIAEVKSTQTAKRHYDKNRVKNILLLNDDFLEYPKFVRELKKDETVEGWDQYLKYCQEKKNLCLKCDINYLRNKIEYEHMKHFNIRVYIDYKNDIAYIIGAIFKKDFIDNSTIKQMIKPKKSEYALYVAANLKNGFKFNNLDSLK